MEGLVIKDWCWRRYRCADEEVNTPMSDEELHELACDALYRECSISPTNSFQCKESGADLYITRRDVEGFRANLIVVVKKDEEEPFLEDIDTSWVLTRYRRKGEFPRLVEAEIYCESKVSVNGRPVVHGGRIGFRFTYHSLIPERQNEVLPEILSNKEVAIRFLKAWEKYDTHIVKPYLDIDFHFASHWMFDVLSCKEEYLYYLSSRFKKWKDKSLVMDLALGYDKERDQFAILIHCDDDRLALELSIKEGRIRSAYMDEDNGIYEKVKVHENICMNHEHDLEGMMPSMDYYKENIDEIIDNSNQWCVGCTATFTKEDGVSWKTKVNSVKYGLNDLSLLSLIVQNEHSDNTECVSSYPLMKGYPWRATIKKIAEWDNGIEAVIYASIRNCDIAFFAADYYLNRNFYHVGNTINLDLAALGLSVKSSEPLRVTRSSKNRTLLGNFLHKDKKESFMDSQSPAHIDFVDDMYPNEAVFHTAISNINRTSLFFKNYYHADMELLSFSGKHKCIPIYFSADFLSSVEENMVIQGRLWLSGMISGMFMGELGLMSRECADIAHAFVNKYSKRWSYKREFDRLLVEIGGVVDDLKEIRIHEGYVLRAYQVGDQHGGMTKVYCSRRDAIKPYQSKNRFGTFLPYDPSCLIPSHLDWKEDVEVPSVLKYFEVPFTERGIMEAWLLDNLSDFLPLFWHAGYGERHYIFSSDDIVQLFSAPKDNDKFEDYTGRIKECGAIMLALDVKCLLPHITIKESSAVISLTFWNDWSGLERVDIPVEKKGGSVEFGKESSFILYPYDCGIMF